MFNQGCAIDKALKIMQVFFQVSLFRSSPIAQTFFNLKSYEESK